LPKPLICWGFRTTRTSPLLWHCSRFAASHTTSGPSKSTSRCTPKHSRYCSFGMASR
jgi:hypothetical protein